MNACLRVQRAAQSRILLRKQGDQASQLLLPDVETELNEQGERVDSLIHEINLLGSERVRKVAGDVAGLALAARIVSTVPPGLKGSKVEPLEQKLVEVRDKLLKDVLPRFRAVVREEIGLR